MKKQYINPIVSVSPLSSCTILCGSSSSGDTGGNTNGSSPQIGGTLTDSQMSDLGFSNLSKGNGFVFVDH